MQWRDLTPVSPRESRTEVKACGKPRIAFVAQQWDYGDPARGHSFEYSTFYEALNGMGCEVVLYDFASREREIGRSAMNDELMTVVRSEAPDLVFFFLFKDEIAPETIKTLTAEGYTTCNWFADDHWRFETFSKHIAPAFSFVATTDPTSASKYREMGCRSILTQWASTPAALPVERRYGYDVSFVGQRYGERPRAIRRLQKAGIDVACFGFGWDRGRVTEAEMRDIFVTSRINLNFTASYGGRLWKRHPVRSQIKARIFEVTGAGGFLLTEQAPGLTDYFEPDREIGVFETSSDLVDAVSFWLENDTLRERAADAAYRSVCSKHTYAHRFSEILRVAGLHD